VNVLRALSRCNQAIACNETPRVDGQQACTASNVRKFFRLQENHEMKFLKYKDLFFLDLKKFYKYN
jgi:hypothetical protein